MVASVPSFDLLLTVDDCLEPPLLSEKVLVHATCTYLFPTCFPRRRRATKDMVNEIHQGYDMTTL